MRKHLLKATAVILTLSMFIILNPGKGFSQGTEEPGKQSVKKSQALTPEQSAKIKSVLSGYDASKLSADDAKVIMQKFREAGIKGGPDVKKAITDAGFDPEKLRQLAPPPEKKDMEKNKSAMLEQRMKMAGEKIINPLNLPAPEKQKVEKAFKDFFTEIDKLPRTKDKDQKAAEKSKVQSMEKARDEKISKILTKEQFAKYQELIKSSQPQKPTRK